MRSGRREEFAAFGWQAEPPVRQINDFFMRQAKSPIARRRSISSAFPILPETYSLAKELAPLARLGREDCEVTAFENDRVLLLNRRCVDEQVVSMFNFNHFPASISLPLTEGRWNNIARFRLLMFAGKASVAGCRAQSKCREPQAFTLPPDSVVVFARRAIGSAN